MSETNKKIPAAIRKLLPHEDFNLDVCSTRRTAATVEMEVDAPAVEIVPEEKEEKKKGVPPAVRSIIENQPLADLIKQNCVCKKCKRVGQLELSFPSVSVATTPTLKCCHCSTASVASIQTTQLPRGLRNVKVTDFSVNVLYVLSFVLSGDGGTEAQRVLGLLGLPHVQSMADDTFAKVEAELSPTIDKIKEEVLNEALSEEVKTTMEMDPEFDFRVWKTALESGAKLPSHQCAEVVVSMDMGWQKRSSGRRYDSLSGHAALIGLGIRKPIALAVKIKAGPQKNHEGSSGSMESAALIDMMKVLFEKNVLVVSVVTDDDSKMQSQTKWSNEDYANNYGKDPPVVVVNGKNKYRKGGVLPGHMPEPNFLADPAHRKKILRNRLYAVVKRKKENRHGMNEGDIIRITTNFIYMANQLTLLEPVEWEDAGKAVYEHHFDDHTYCGDFCKRGRELDELKKKGGTIPTTSDEPKKFYRSKEKDAELYAALKEIVDDLTTPERLIQVGHGHDTNVNEALNNVISWFAPKNKNYCFTVSLFTRVSIAIIIFNIGYCEFFRRVFLELGVEYDGPTAYYAELKESQRQTKSDKSKSNDAKKKRNQKIYDKLKAYIAESVSDRNEGTGYSTGVALDSDVVVVCKSCGKEGHKTSNNKLCVNFKPRMRKNKLDKVREAEDNASQQAMMDLIPIDNPTDKDAAIAKEVMRIDMEAEF